MGGAGGSRDFADFLTTQKLRKPLPRNDFRTRSQRRDRWVGAFSPYGRPTQKQPMARKTTRKPKQKHPLQSAPALSQDTCSGFPEDTSSGCSACHCSRCLASRGTRLCQHCGTTQPLTGFRRNTGGTYHRRCKRCTLIVERAARRGTQDDLDALQALETASTAQHAGETLRELVRRHHGHQGLADWLAHLLDSATAQGRMRDAAHILAALAVIGGLAVLADPQEIRERIRGNRT